MKQEQKKWKNNQKINQNYIIIAIIAVIVLAFAGFLLIKGCSNNKNNDNNENSETPKREIVSEESLINAYGMSKEDAINIVKEIYNGDSYEFTAEINEDAKYVVTANNILTKTSSKFLVDPTSTSKSFYEINE